MTDDFTLDYAAECKRLRDALRRLSEAVDPQLGYSGRWIADMAAKILDGTN